MKSNPNLVQVLFEMSLFLTQLPMQPRVSNLLGSAACFRSTFSHSFNLYNLFQSLALISFGYRRLPGHHVLRLPRAKDLVHLIGTLVFPISLLLAPPPAVLRDSFLKQDMPKVSGQLSQNNN